MAATVAGVNPFSSPFQLWCRFEGTEPRQEETYPMRRGKFMEAGVIREFSRETKLKVQRPRGNFDQNFWFLTEEYGFPMGCLLDGVTMDSTGRAAVEAKTANPWAAHEWFYDDYEDESANDKVPLVYFMQAQHQLAVTGWQHCYVPADVGGKFIWRLIKRDDGVIDLLTTRERDFWINNVLGHEPPEADAHRATKEAIERRWPSSTPEAVEVVNDPEIARLAATYKAQGETMNHLKAERDGTGNQLKILIQDKEALIAGDYKVSWKTFTKKHFDLDAFRSAHPALAQEFTVEREQRPLKVTQTKEKA